MGKAMHNSSHMAIMTNTMVSIKNIFLCVPMCCKALNYYFIVLPTVLSLEKHSGIVS